MLTIEVCVGSACHLKGSYHVINKFIEIIERDRLEDKVTVKAAFCLGKCTDAVSVRVDSKKIYSTSADNVENFLNGLLEGRLFS